MYVPPIPEISIGVLVVQEFDEHPVSPPLGQHAGGLVVVVWLLNIRPLKMP